jgi:C4-dicarboxylate-specific signal transduction histidine kinase
VSNSPEESSRPTLPHRPLNLGQVVKSSLLQVDQLFTAHGVTLVLNIEKHGARLKGDAEQLQIAIVNVLRNAVEAVAPCARREISVAVKAGKKHVAVIVGDSGPGWPAAIPDEAPLGRPNTAAVASACSWSAPQ